MLQSIRSLMAGIIDYAGLYPPAKLSMQAAVEAYAHAGAGTHEWMLGRLSAPRRAWRSSPRPPPC
jgi:hypothetical protein